MWSKLPIAVDHDAQIIFSFYRSDWNSSSSSDRRGRKSRGERMELTRKERSKTSGRQLEEGWGCLLSSRSKTSGRELGRDGDEDRISPVRSRGDWKRQDRGGRYQVGQFSQFILLSKILFILY